MAPVFLTMRMLRMLRVSEELETKGLDIIKHGEPAYPLVAYGHGWDENSPKVREVMRRLSTANSNFEFFFNNFSIKNFSRNRRTELSGHARVQRQPVQQCCGGAGITVP
jgi:hypothetical protein